MAVNMFRAVFLCVIIAVAQSQLTCIKMSASQMGGGLCDGMMASWSACAASGTTTQPVYAWAGLDAVACGTQQGTMCAIGGGTAHKPFCASGVTSGFCQMIHARLLSKTPTCSTDADCANTLAPDRTVGCCADYKTVLGQMCTGIVDLDAAVIFFLISLSLFCV